MARLTITSAAFPLAEQIVYAWQPSRIICTGVGPRLLHDAVWVSRLVCSGPVVAIPSFIPGGDQGALESLHS